MRTNCAAEGGYCQGFGSQKRCDNRPEKSPKMQRLWTLFPVLGQPKYTGNRFGVADHSFVHHSNGLGKWEEMRLDQLIRLGLSNATFQPPRQVNRHRFVEEAGADIEIQDPLPLLRSVAGLFQQFALGGGQFSFSIIDTTCREFPHHRLRGVPVLSFEQNARVGGGAIDSQDDDRPRVPDDVAASLDSAWLENVIGGDGKYWAFVRDLGRKNSSFG